MTGDTEQEKRTHAYTVELLMCFSTFPSQWMTRTRSWDNGPSFTNDTLEYSELYIGLLPKPKQRSLVLQAESFLM